MMSQFIVYFDFSLMFLITPTTDHKSDNCGVVVSTLDSLSRGPELGIKIEQII